MAYGVDIACAANAEHPQQLAQQVVSSAKTSAKTVNQIGFIGLGAMGYGMATNLLKSNFLVIGYDCYIDGDLSCCAFSGVKMVNQLLAGVHIVASAEAMAFGARLGLNTRVLFEAIKNSRGSSWMPENRVPHMLDNDYTPHSALDIFVKDLGIVSGEGSTRNVPLCVATAAYQQFLSGSAAGFGRGDDTGVVKVYEKLTGASVEGKLPVLKKDVVLSSLPSEWPHDPIEDISMLNQNSSKTLVVLDDDPTGTQTVHGIEVLTEWSVESLVGQFQKRPLCFFILTNSRALCSEKASALIKEICSNLLAAAKSLENVDFTVVLRGDSTLCGHFPEEADTTVSVLGELDAWIICPFFLQGRRFTVDDVHYIAYSDRLVPAGTLRLPKMHLSVTNLPTCASGWKRKREAEFQRAMSHPFPSHYYEKVDR